MTLAPSPQHVRFFGGPLDGTVLTADIDPPDFWLIDGFDGFYETDRQESRTTYYGWTSPLKRSK